MPVYRSLPAFSLTELLVTLTILGVIATFTIPKIIGAQQTTTYNAAGKEVAGLLTGAQQLASLTKGSSLLATTELTPYINYVAVDTASPIDSYQGQATQTCGSSTLKCLKMHSGGMIYYWTNDAHCSSVNPTAFHIGFDPDGRVTDGTTNGPGKSIYFYIYSSGRVRTYGTVETNTTYTNGGAGTACNTTRTATPANDPTWFSWN